MKCQRSTPKVRQAHLLEASFPKDGIIELKYRVRPILFHCQYYLLITEGVGLLLNMEYSIGIVYSSYFGEASTDPAWLNWRGKYIFQLGCIFEHQFKFVCMV